MRAVVTILLTAAVFGAAGCSIPQLGRTPVEKALPFKASLKEEKDGALRVSVKAGVAGLDEVRESVRYVVTRHCLLERGSSDADWLIDPATGDWAIQSDGQGTLNFQARCRA